MSNLAVDGWQIVQTRLSAKTLHTLRESLFTELLAGQRCQLDNPSVREIARELRLELVKKSLLPKPSLAIQAITFNKAFQKNWRVTWHQDLMFPVSITSLGPELGRASYKDGAPHVRLSRDILDRLLVVRLHLDDCQKTNGPLRVIPRSHNLGIIPSSELSQMAECAPEVTCLASPGDALLMRPLLLHASSATQSSLPRRVLHYVYDTSPPSNDFWYRAI